MQFFLDTANLEQIKKYAEWGVVDGVTTNPSLVAKEKVSMEKRIKEIAEVIDGPISTEVTATDAKGMIAQGREFAAWHDNVCIKLPTTSEGIKALTVLAEEEIKTNLTLVFSPGQALLVAKAGATYVSPFIGRLDDVSEPGMGVIVEIMEIFNSFNIDTKVIVASVRHPRHVIESARMGADVATVPPTILEKMIHHPLTDIGVEKFLADWDTVKDLQK